MFNRFSRVASAAAVAVLASPAFAQGTTMTAILDAVDLDGIGTAVGAAGLIIVSVALLFKAPSLAKKIISKV